MNLTTKAPRDSQGMSFRLTAGERETLDADFRIATELGGGWYMKAVGRAHHARTFAVSRRELVEYSVPCQEGQFGDCLPLDGLELDDDNTATHYAGGVRVDKYFSDDRRLTLEAAMSTRRCCGALATGGGRVRINGGGGDVWGRIELDVDAALLTGWTLSSSPRSRRPRSSSF